MGSLELNRQVETGCHDQLKGEYWLTRIVYLRCLGFLCLVAFTISLLQNEGLIGEDGLTPATLFIDRYQQYFQKNLNQFKVKSPFLQVLEPITTYFEITVDHRIVGFLNHPTIFWYIVPTTRHIVMTSAAGCGLSWLVFLRGASNIPMMFTIWLLYFSIVNIGQTWYSFGWESQLWSLIWLLFRIMIGAGMIKIRGDQCWRDLTCMNYHYQTQPVPNPISIYFHNTPDLFHKFETLANHIVELLFPFLLLVPHRRTQMIGGFFQIIFQFVLISSGNLSFLNWLTALPGLACFDDYFYALFFNQIEVQSALRAAKTYQDTIESFSESTAKSQYQHKKDDDVMAPQVNAKKKSMVDKYLKYSFSWHSLVVLMRRLLSVFLFIWIGRLSYPVIQNILSPNQGMNISFDPFRIVNSYGAFGSVTKIRHEVIIQGTSDNSVSPSTQWKEFQFSCKPGDINRRPCLISPYHFRMDWLMWFAAFQNYQQCSWIVHFADKLLRGEREPNLLLAPNGNPFYNVSTSRSDAHRLAPKIIRAVLYEYEYPGLTEEQRNREAAAGWEVGKWWKRRYTQEYMPPIDANNPSVEQFLIGNGLTRK